MKLSMPVFLLAATASTSASESSCKEDVTSIEHHENLVANYLKIWNGEDFSLVDETFSPDVFVHFDRLPSGEGKDGDGSVPLEFHDRDAFLEFVKSSRTGWDEYTFQVYFSAAQGLHGAFRWGLKAVVGADFDLVETCVSGQRLLLDSLLSWFVFKLHD